MRGTKAKALRKRARELSVGMPVRELKEMEGFRRFSKGPKKPVGHWYIVFNIAKSTRSIYQQLKKGRMS